MIRFKYVIAPEAHNTPGIPITPGTLRTSTALTSTFGLLLLFFVVGCELGDYRPRAVGPEAKMYVVIDSTQWNGEVGDAVREALGGPILTLPVPEPAFDVSRASIRSQDAFDAVKKQKNVVFVAPLSDTTLVAKFISARLDEGARSMIESGNSGIIPREDLWRKGQMVVYITASTPENLISTLTEKSTDLRYVFNNKIRERLKVSMFEKGRQLEVEEQLLEKYDFSVNAQHDYFVAVDTTDFIWMRRVISSETWRSLFIYFEENGDPNELSPEWVYSKRDSLTKRYVRGNVAGFVEIDRRRPLTTENINFLDRYGFETRGLWQMVAIDNGQQVPLGMGGAFVTYAFYDEDSGRNYLIDGMVFAPNYNKREFLRQLEVIAHTFRTREEVAETQQLAKAD